MTGPDVTAPVLNLIGASAVSVVQFSSYDELGAIAIDDRDGDISGNVLISGSVDVNTIGSYTLTYNVADAAGNAAASVQRV